MLEFVLLAGAGLALWHLVMDGIISADLQLATRAEAQAASVALERLRAQRPAIKGRGYDLVHDAYAGLVRHPTAFSIWSFSEMRTQLAHDGELQRQVAERRQEVDGIKDPDLKRFRDRVPELGLKFLTVNSIGWAIYLVPVGFALAMYRKTYQTLAALISLPETQLSKIDRGPRSTMDRCFH